MTGAASRPGARIGVVLTAALVGAVIGHWIGWVPGRTLDLVCLASLAWGLWRLGGTIGRGVAGVLAVGVTGVLFALHQADPALRFMPYLLIVPANLAIAYIFAEGLRPGRQPFMLRLIRLIGRAPVDDAAFQRFVRGQCALWAVFSLATGVLAFAALWWRGVAPWLDTALVTVIVVQVAWFYLSHVYANRRYGRPETWWATVRTMARPDVWAGIGAR